MRKYRYAPFFLTFLVLIVFAVSANAQTLTPDRTSLTFTSPTNSVQSQIVQVTAPTGATFIATTNELSCGNTTWLTVTPNFTTQSVPASVQITANASGIQAPATCTGTVTLFGTSGAANATISVTMNVTTGVGNVNPNPVNISVPTNSTTPVSTNVALTNSGSTVITGVAQVKSLTGSGCPGSSWLTFGVGNANASYAVPANGGVINIPFTVNPTGFTAGTCTAVVTLPGYGDVNVNITVSQTQVLQSDKTSLSFAYQSTTGNGITFPQAQSLTISANPSAAVPVVVTVNNNLNGWLVVSNANQTLTTPVTMTVSTDPTRVAQLPVSSQPYTATITVTPLNSTAPVLSIPVNLTVSTNAVLVVTPASFSTVNYTGGALPTPLSAQLTTTSNTATQFTITSDQPWLQVTSSSPTAAANAPATLNFAFANLQILPPGNNTANVTITPVGGGAVIKIPITVNVSTVSQLLVVPQQVIFNYEKGSNIAPPNPVVTVNSTGAPTTFTIDPSPVNWLVITPSSNTTPATITFSPVVLASLEAQVVGTQNVPINITPAGGGSPVRVNVVLNVSAAGTPLFNVSPSALPFTVPAGQTTPVSQNLTLTSTSTNPANPVRVQVTNGGSPWLSVTGISQLPGTITVTVNPALVPATGASDSITITQISPAPGANVQPTVIPVNVNVVLGALTLNPSTLTFNQTVGANAPAAQAIQVGSTNQPLNFNVTTSASWLTVDKPNGTTPTTVNVTANGVGMVAGTYTGRVIFSAGNNQPAVEVPVTLVVGAPTATLTPASVTFAQNQGAPTPPTQTVRLDTAGVSLPYNTVVSSNATWLNVISGASGNTPGSIVLQANAGTLPAGTYSGNVSVNIPGAATPTLNIPVTFNVGTAANLIVAPTTVTNLTAQTGSTAAQTTSLTVQSSSSTPLPYTATVSSGSNFLTISSGASGNTPGTVVIAANPTGLAAGTYNGSITIASPGASNGSIIVPVTFTVASPSPAFTTVVNSGRNEAGAVSPGELVTIYGANMGPTAGVGGSVANGFVTTQAGGVRVLFDNIPAPILYASATQINAIVPYEIAGRPTTQVRVEFNNVQSSNLTLNVTDVNPGLFTHNAAGTGPTAYHANFTPVTQASPAQKGEVIIMFATGEGLLSTRQATGQVSTIVDAPIQPVTVTFAALPGQPTSGTTVTPDFAGGVPGFVAGAIQINVRVPDTLGSGTQNVRLNIGSAQSNSATIFVQ